MPGLLIIAHAPLASALKLAAQHCFPDADPQLQAVDVPPNLPCDELEAQARLLLGPAIPHHQSSWVKLTLPVAAEALRWGCDDLGGTLMEEHITTMAGARANRCGRRHQPSPASAGSKT